MLFARSLRYCAVVFAFCLLPALAQAQTRQDTQFWFMFLDTHAFSPKWRAHLEVQPRWSEDASELDHTLFRWAIGRALTNRVSVWGGHAWVPRTLGEGVRHEHRLWQQVLATLPAKARWNPTIRVRLEQRFQNWEDNSHRFRLMARGVRPLGASPWSIATYDELFVNFDKTERGPARGFDRNRVFGGVARRLSPKAGLEFGYLLQTTNPPTAPPRQDHAAVVTLNLSY